MSDAVGCFPSRCVPEIGQDQNGVIVHRAFRLHDGIRRCLSVYETLPRHIHRSGNFCLRQLGEALSIQMKSPRAGIKENQEHNQDQGDQPGGKFFYGGHVMLYLCTLIVRIIKPTGHRKV